MIFIRLTINYIIDTSFYFYYESFIIFELSVNILKKFFNNYIKLHRIRSLNKCYYRQLIKIIMIDSIN